MSHDPHMAAVKSTAIIYNACQVHYQKQTSSWSAPMVTFLPKKKGCTCGNAENINNNNIREENCAEYKVNLSFV